MLPDDRQRVILFNGFLFNSYYSIAVTNLAIISDDNYTESDTQLPTKAYIIDMFNMLL